MASLLSMSVDRDRDGLRPGEREQPLEALLAAVAGEPPAAEWELDAAARPEGVDEDLAGLELARERVRLADVARPHSRDEPVPRRVRERGRLVDVAKRNHAQHRPEDLVLRERRVGRDVDEQGRLEEEPG